MKLDEPVESRDGTGSNPQLNLDRPLFENKNVEPAKVINISESSSIIDRNAYMSALQSKLYFLYDRHDVSYDRTLPTATHFISYVKNKYGIEIKTILSESYNNESVYNRDEKPEYKKYNYVSKKRTPYYGIEEAKQNEWKTEDFLNQIVDRQETFSGTRISDISIHKETIEVFKKNDIKIRNARKSLPDWKSPLFSSSKDWYTSSDSFLKFMKKSTPNEFQRRGVDRVINDISRKGNQATMMIYGGSHIMTDMQEEFNVIGTKPKLKREYKETIGSGDASRAMQFDFGTWEDCRLNNFAREERSDLNPVLIIPETVFDDMFVYVQNKNEEGFFAADARFFKSKYPNLKSTPNAVRYRPYYRADTVFKDVSDITKPRNKFVVVTGRFELSLIDSLLKKEEVDTIAKHWIEKEGVQQTHEETHKHYPKEKLAKYGPKILSVIDRYYA